MNPDATPASPKTSRRGKAMTISVKVRANTKAESKIAGFADVLLELPEGKIELNSFAVFKPNGNSKPSVAPAALKGEKKFFPYYALSGELRKQVETEIMREFDRHVNGPSKKS
jgi:hypothetical protein